MEIRSRWSPGEGRSDDEQWDEVWIDRVASPFVAERLEIRGSLVTTGLPGATLAGTRVIDSRFVDSELAGTSFTGLTFTRVEFVGCRMWAVQFDDCTFREVRFVDCLLDDANFRVADADHVDVIGCRTVGADLSSSRWPGSRWSRCDLTGTTLSQAEFRDASFPGSTLASLVGAQFLAGASIDESQAMEVGRSLLGAHTIRTVADDTRSASRSVPDSER